MLLALQLDDPSDSSDSDDSDDFIEDSDHEDLCGISYDYFVWQYGSKYTNDPENACNICSFSMKDHKDAEACKRTRVEARNESKKSV